MRKRYSIPLIVFLFLLGTQLSTGQVTKIRGKVVDAGSGEPVPFANVFFKGTTIGVSSDFSGEFSLETTTPSDTLIASFMGYEMLAKPVMKNRFQEIVFELHPSSYTLSEFVVKAGENPAEILLRKIIENKSRNYKKELDYYQYEVYNKIQIDANNLSEQFQNRRIMRPFRFIFDYADTSTINGKTYLPIFLSESMSDFYYRNSPRTEKEVIRAAQVSGVENESVLQYVGDMFQNYSIYENYIPLFLKNFTSPVADFGLSFYKYYLVDSTHLDSKWCYKVMFKPRRKQELTFTGHFWVHDTTFAIKSFEMRIVEDANLNYVSHLLLNQEFDLIDNQYWMVTLDRGVGDFNILQDNNTTLGFFGKKTTTYRNFVFNRPLDPSFYSSPTNVIVEKSAYQKEEDFWEQNRHTELSKDERTIYFLIDTLKNLPAFKTWVEIVQTAITGYYELGKYEIGPYMSLLSFNSVEGTRFRFGGRTTSNFSTKIRYGAYIAFGLKDQSVKFGTSALFLLNPNPRRALSANYKNDMEQLGNSPNAFREDFFLAALFRRNPVDKLSLTREVNLNYEHEWFNGFSNQFNLMQKVILPVGRTVIETSNGTGTPDRIKSLTTTEIAIHTRLAYKERFVLTTFDRVSLGTKYPVLAFEYGYGIPGFLNGQYEYHKIKAGMRHWFNVFHLGWSKYIIEGGFISGRLPFPLLRLHPGNETFIFDEYAYNLMNYYEFVSDRYISLYFSHHFDGFFLNRIPLMRKLKWREVVYFRGVAGSLSNRNLEYNYLPSYTHILNKPYFEAGVGLENVFKIFRVDGIWRLSHPEHTNINRFALFVSFYFSF